MFSLSFIEDPDSERFSFDPETEIVGKIRLGDFEEHFVANITFWSADDYRAQWEEGLSRVCEGATQSCVLTSVCNPELANVFWVWDLYRFGTETTFHNRLLPLDKLTEPFLFNRLYETIPPYRAINEDGEAISEWKVPVRMIQEFLDIGMP